MLGSRQLAVVVWGVIFVVWAMTNRDVRSSLANVLRLLISPKIALPFSLIIGWNIAVIWGLRWVGFWNPAMLYDTVLFVVVGGIGSVSKAATRGVTYDGRFFLRTILENFGFIVLFAFMSDFFAFNFWIEFLLVVPLMTLLVTLVVVSENQKGAEGAHRFLSGTQSFVGILLIGYVAWKGITEFHQLANLHVLYAFLLPLVMSIMFVPLLLLVCALMAYEDAYLHLAWCPDEVQRLVRFKKWRLFLRFGLALKQMQLFRRARVFQELRCSATKDDVRRIFRSWEGYETEQDEPADDDEEDEE